MKGSMARAIGVAVRQVMVLQLLSAALIQRCDKYFPALQHAIGELRRQIAEALHSDSCLIVVYDQD